MDDDDTYKPTPTQYEVDMAAHGESQMVKTPDGSPEENGSTRRSREAPMDEIYRPTPSQWEADAAAEGKSHMTKVPDGSPETGPPSPPIEVPEPQSKDEHELNFRTRTFEPEHPSGAYKTRAQRRAEAHERHDEGSGV